MLKSDQIGELAKALAAAQKEMKPPKKARTAKIESQKGRYSYKYADLSDVIESYREPLTKNGLSLVQPIGQRDGHLIITTTLIHVSGQFIADEYPVASHDRPQEQGSALTYARRYTASAMLGIASEDDDDGEAAQNATPAKREPEPEDAPPPDGPSLSDDHRADLMAVAKRKGLVVGKQTDDLKKWLAKYLKRPIGSSADVKEAEWEGVVSELEKLPERREA